MCNFAVLVVLAKAGIMDGSPDHAIKPMALDGAAAGCDASRSYITPPLLHFALLLLTFQKRQKINPRVHDLAANL